MYFNDDGKLLLHTEALWIQMKFEFNILYKQLHLTRFIINQISILAVVESILKIGFSNEFRFINMNFIIKEFVNILCMKSVFHDNKSL